MDRFEINNETIRGDYRLKYNWYFENKDLENFLNNYGHDMDEPKNKEYSKMFKEIRKKYWTDIILRKFFVNVSIIGCSIMEIELLRKLNGETFNACIDELYQMDLTKEIINATQDISYMHLIKKHTGKNEEIVNSMYLEVLKAYGKNLKHIPIYIAEANIPKFLKCQADVRFSLLDVKNILNGKCYIEYGAREILKEILLGLKEFIDYIVDEDDVKRIIDGK